jgi:4-azaleucine resistance transporter AzlC
MMNQGTSPMLGTPSAAREFRDGVMAVIPAAAAVVPFGLLLGTLAVQKGLSVAEVALMSALVFAGSAQFVAIDLWREPTPWLLIGFSALTINLRHLMMGLSFNRHLGRFRPWQRYAAVYLMADETWALAERRAADGELRPAFYGGLAVTLYVSFVLFSVLGAIAGAAITDPAAWGFDFAFTAIFIGLIVGFWRGHATGLVIGASAAVAIGTQAWLGGVWHVLAGGAAGAGAAALLSVLGAKGRRRGHDD